MSRIIILAVLVAVLVAALAAAIPALAQESPSGCEIAHECGEGQQKFLPPGTPFSAGLWGWDPFGQYKWLGLYDLAAICNNYGGYYYETPDTPEGYAWQSCDGVNGTGNTG